MRKWIRLIIGLFACGMLTYSVYQMIHFGMQSMESTKLNELLTLQAVTPRETASVQGADVPAETGEELQETRLQAPIQVDFDLLKKQSGDVVGWLYCEDTPINLPLAQAGDNERYLRRLLDGTENNSGTLFVDFRNYRDFSDWNTIVYGHNMRNGEMFGTLHKYGEQKYYDAHPILWLLTPEGDYKVELVAGFITSSTSDAYLIPDTAEEAQALIQEEVQKSTFQTGLTLNPGDRYLTLSTCSYEFDEARYVLVGRLVS